MEAASAFAASSTFVFSSGVLKIGTITAWIGASRGGSTSPWSSLCVMMRPPTSRVETPQLVAQACSSLPSLFWNCTSNALAKFWPRKWLVPACRAFLSCIIASMQSV